MDLTALPVVLNNIELKQVPSESFLGVQFDDTEVVSTYLQSIQLHKQKDRNDVKNKKFCFTKYPKNSVQYTHPTPPHLWNPVMGRNL